MREEAGWLNALGLCKAKILVREEKKGKAGKWLNVLVYISRKIA